jgi:hypothetical protein
MAKYVKLGKKAESFYDPYSTLKVVGNQIVELNPKMQTSSRVRAALAGGHLVPVTQSEFNTSKGVVPEETIESKFGKTAKELSAYYDATYEVSKQAMKTFKKLSLEEMVEELEKLEQESSE